MTLRFYNQLTKNIDEFMPHVPGEVSLYTCGPTVYSYPTVGNWAAYIYWDVLVRILEKNGNKVSRVMNITDVGHLVSDADEGDDKLEAGAKKEGKTAQEIAKFYTEDFLLGMKQLNMVEPTYLPRATEYIDAQLRLAIDLKNKGFTYQISDGIYFDTSKFENYPKFAGLNLLGQMAGARVESNPEKRNPTDFALWKFTPNGVVRDMQWQTPIDLLDDSTETRFGFPGWHLECSAMALELLGKTIDIHTGGIDHIPVHHTNEIAQSEASNGTILAHYWLHNNHLKVDGVKISKSLGNGYTLNSLIERGYHPMDFRLFILQGNYTSEGNFTFEGLNAAKNRRLRWRNIAALRHQMHDTLSGNSDTNKLSLYGANRALLETVENCLNTPEGLALVDATFHKIASSPIKNIDQSAFVSFLETIDEILGIDIINSSPDISDDEKQLILERVRARESGNYSVSDEIRNKLEKSGIAINDTPSGVIWEYIS